MQNAAIHAGERRRAATGRSGRHRRAGGFYLLEFTFLFAVMVLLLGASVEFLRLAVSDQVLARATHVAAWSAGRNPDTCKQAAEDVFEDDIVASWLFDRDDDGNLGFVWDSEPDGSSDGELGLEIVADDGVISNGIDFSESLCGNDGSWLRVRSIVPVRARFAWDTVLLRAESWALNQK